jgi:hypothetical protein
MLRTYSYPDSQGLCLFGFFYFESYEQFFSYLATVTITGDGVANLDLVCLALTAFSSEGSFTCHTYCDTGPPFLRSYPKDPWFSLLNAVLLAKEQSLPILNVFGLTRPARAGLELTTYRLLSETTTTRLRKRVIHTNFHIAPCISPRHQYRPEGRRPEGWYWSRADTECDMEMGMFY